MKLRWGFFSKYGIIFFKNFRLYPSKKWNDLGISLIGCPVMTSVNKQIPCAKWAWFGNSTILKTGSDHPIGPGWSRTLVQRVHQLASNCYALMLFALWFFGLWLIRQATSIKCDQLLRRFMKNTSILWGDLILKF